MCNMYIWGEYGGGMGWNETGWVFRGDAKLAHSAVWLDVFVEGRDFCLGGTRNWRRSVVWLGCGCGRTGLLFGGNAELAQERDSAGCVCEFVGRMIYIQAGQSLTSRACSTVGGAN